MKALNSLLQVVVAFFVIMVTVASMLKEGAQEERYQEQVTEDLIPKGGGYSQQANGSFQRGMHLYNSNYHIPLSRLDRTISKNDGVDGILIYSGSYGRSLYASAPNIDEQHEIVNSYLVGYSPFNTDNLWIPYLTLARQKSYQYDHLLYDGRKEVWQTSEQAFKFTRGDCEDHAIALADWLIELGEDARVVMGDYKGEGHAWVVLFKNGKEFLLEATRKVNRRSVMRYPLAQYETSYRPRYMFNRTEFWVNDGSVYTTRYSSDKWTKKSHYQL